VTTAKRVWKDLTTCISLTFVSAEECRLGLGQMILLRAAVLPVKLDDYDDDDLDDADAGEGQ